MTDPTKRIVVSQVLDSKPRIFSLPVAIIMPLLMVGTSTGFIAYILQLSPYSILAVVIVSIALYFFLFGQEGWRLIAKFRKQPDWVRSDIQAIPFTLNRNEKAIKGREHKAARRKKAKRSH
ncbi:hypothetical protein [Synechococcus sp. PCC 7335]|uniref:hypothetical protein n=1 Tax=Synechococcus sp. (strain ATCC 29403 / PCC 7335) TaxID=91464 RepID=UPI0018DB15EF|nr:hypothetical protein [Synechococcus sp. PCC 7335]